jgi:hypothetical protein
MRGSVRVITMTLFVIGSSNNSVKKLVMTNKELFLTFFDVESATIIDIKYRNIGKIQLLLNPTEKNKFMDRLPIRLLCEVNEIYSSRIATNSDELFNIFKYIGFDAREITDICREIHRDMGSKKLIVP